MSRVRVQEHVLAARDISAIVRHVRVHGSNAEIGQVVAGLAIAGQRVRPEDLLGDGRYVRARRLYFQRTYRTHLERMRGVARAFGLRLDDDRFDFSILRGTGDGAALRDLEGTASYSPPWASECGHSLLRRDGVLSEPHEGPLELYLMEWHSPGMPFGSTAVHIGDVLSGAVVGINAAGVGVGAVGVEMPAANAARRADRGANVSAVGLHELGLVRLVLDTCRTVEEAQAALLAAQVFPMDGYARYLVADLSGRSFAYETSVDHRVQRIVDGGGESQIISSWDSVEEPTESGWRCILDLDRRSVEVILRSPATPAAETQDRWAPECEPPLGGPAVTVRLGAKARTR